MEGIMEYRKTKSLNKIFFLIFIFIFLVSARISAQTIKPLSPKGNKVLSEKIQSYPLFDAKQTEEKAKEIYKIVKRGDEVTLRYRNKVQTGAFMELTGRFVQIGSKRISQADLSPEQLAQFYPQKTKDLRAAYLKRQKISYEKQKVAFFKKLRAQLFEQYPAIDMELMDFLFHKFKNPETRFEIINKFIALYDSSLPLKGNKKTFVLNLIKKFVNDTPSLTIDTKGFIREKATLVQENKDIKTSREMAQRRKEQRYMSPKTATPFFEPAGGAFAPDKPVKIFCATPRSSIYYTTDNSEPNEKSIPYSKPIKMNSPVTIKAVALHPDYNDSNKIELPMWQEGEFKGYYFKRMNFTGKTFSRKEKILDFDWGMSSPNKKMLPNFFSVIWVGRILAPQSGDFTFYLTGNDGVRMWFNGKLIINGWLEQQATEYTCKVNLKAGQFYDFKVAYVDCEGEAAARLEWSGPLINRQDIPQKYFYPDGTYAEEMQKWNEFKGGIYVNRDSMTNPGSYKGTVLFNKNPEKRRAMFNEK
jgi:hypothetical protein